ncbi:MAG: hypothetical protein ABWY25_07530 [Paenisporosarcina sp.]
MRKVLNASDIAIIYEKILARQSDFDENLKTSIGVVLMNYGDRHVKVRCINDHCWHGTKGEIRGRQGGRDGIPLCPSGHSLLEMSEAPLLALIEVEDVDG